MVRPGRESRPLAIGARRAYTTEGWRIMGGPSALPLELFESVHRPEGDGCGVWCLWVPRCPHCGIEGFDIVEVVESARMVNAGSLFVEDGRLARLAWGVGEPEVQHVTDRCVRCRNPVTLPEEDFDRDRN